MKFPIKLTRVSGYLSRSSNYRSMIWLALTAMLLLAATSSAVWNVQDAAGVPPDHVGGTVPPGQSECKGGNLVARPDIAGTTSSSSVQFLPLQNDSAVPDPKGKNELKSTTALTLTSVTTPTHGTVTSDTVDATTTLTYTPTPAGDFTGSDGFSYTIIDECGREATGHVRVVVFRDDMPSQPAIISRPPNPGQGAKQTLTLPVSATLSVPAEIFAETNDETDLHHFTVTDLGKPQELLNDRPGPGQRIANVAFGLSEFRNDNEVERPAYQVPLILEIASEGQADPQLFYWDVDDNEWRRDGIERLSHDPESGVATFAIHHLTDFALFAETPAQQTQSLFLPSIMRGGNQ